MNLPMGLCLSASFWPILLNCFGMVSPLSSLIGDLPSYSRARPVAIDCASEVPPSSGEVSEPFSFYCEKGYLRFYWVIGTALNCSLS